MCDKLSRFECRGTGAAGWDIQEDNKATEGPNVVEEHEGNTCKALCSMSLKMSASMCRM